MVSNTLTLKDIKAARERIGKIIHRTALDHSRTFSEMTGLPVYLKLENLQKTGSFKLRGALNKILTLDSDQARRGVIAASAGNHAQGVAFGATAAGIASTIVMPESAPMAKAAATRGYGAEVILAGANYDAAYATSLEIAKREGQTFIHAFDDPVVMAGQGTMGLEILEDLPETGTVVIPIGGGGLAAGMAVALKEMKPGIKIIGVQAAGAPAVAETFRNHCRTETLSAVTMADGIAVMKPGMITCEVIQNYLDDVVTVEEEEIARAILLMLERSKLTVEGAGAVSLAALISGKIPHTTLPVVPILSGGNIDVNVISRIIERGLAQAGRRVRLSAIVPDQPGNLQKILGIVADKKANVVQVYHAMDVKSASFSQVEVDMTLETRDKAHAEEIVIALCKAGYFVELR